MTKKDYIKFASMIKERREELEQDNNLTHLAELQTLTGRIANIFQDDNPSFDRKTFFKACGYSVAR